MRRLNHLLLVVVTGMALLVVARAGPALDEHRAGAIPDVPSDARSALGDAPFAPSTAPSTAAVDSPEHRRATERGEAALATIAYRWRQHLPGWEIRFLAADEGAYGYTMTREHRIDVYVRDDQSDALLAHVVAHEIGHAVDVTLNSAKDRSRWEQARGITDAPWWPDERAADFATGAGDFAECFAVWQVGLGSFRSELGDPPSPEQQALLAELSHP
jgi:hypothetical protein